jgi:hypothetical protein
MKQTLIKNFSMLLGLTAMLGFSSCLKDSNYVDFGAVGTTVEIPLSGTANFSKGSLTESTDEIVKQFAVNVASPKPLGTDLTVTLSVDAAALTAYNASQTAVLFEPFPTDSYTIDKTSVVIPAGTRTQVITVTFDKTKLDPAKSYLLPITISDAQGQTINGNYRTKYYSIIGNDFAGEYQWQFTRTPAAGNFTYADGEHAIIFPVTPRIFEVAGGYFTGNIRYRVTFQKTGVGPAALYHHFSIVINPSDVTDILGAQSPPIVITTAPSIVGYVEKNYTFAEALQLLDNGLTYGVTGGSGVRKNLDQYKK